MYFILPMTSEKHQKNIKNFLCNFCDFNCSKLGDYKRHILTPKHLRLTFSSNILPKKTSHCDEVFKCHCGKEYLHRQSLYNHKKKCPEKKCPEKNPEKNPEKKSNILEEDKTGIEYMKDIIDTLVEDRDKDRSMMTEILNQNKILQEQLIMSNTTTNNITNHNTQNNNFNMSFFLNEQCKNAMNISDFLNTVEVELEDVANVGKLGYVEGISRIFMKALNNLDVYERPIHCSDLKRDVMYVKDNGIWEKEGEDKTSLKKAVQVISHRNVMKIKAWTDANPSWKTHYSKEEDEYLKISYESMGGSTKEEDDKYFNKIIRKVASNVTIYKKKKNEINE